MAEDNEKLENASDNLVKPLRNEKGQLLPNQPSLNPLGKPLGTRDFATDFDEAVDEIAKDNNITRSEARKILFKVAYKNAKDGNYSFYKDIQDRVYGTATHKADLTTNGESLNPIDPSAPTVLELMEKLREANEQK